MGEEGDSIINNYLKLIDVNPKDFWRSRELPIINLRFVVLALLHDYFNGKIHKRKIKIAAKSLFWIQNSEFWNHSELEKYDKKLEEILSFIIETTWKKVKIEYYNTRLKEIAEEYYEKYKYIIDPYIK
jgi:hypothetical protein